MHLLIWELCHLMLFHCVLALLTPGLALLHPITDTMFLNFLLLQQSYSTIQMFHPLPVMAEFVVYVVFLILFKSFMHYVCYMS